MLALLKTVPRRNLFPCDDSSLAPGEINWERYSFQLASGVMSFGMAVGAEQTTLGRLSCKNFITSIGHGSQVQLETFLGRIEMMPGQGCIVLSITAAFATPATFRDQREFPAQATCLLADVVLMPIVGVAVLALQATELPLPALEYPPTARAGSLSRQFLLHI